MLLGLDIGTSAVKAALVRDGVLIETASAELTVLSPRPGWSEQRADQWWDGVRAALGKLQTPLGDVRGIGLSGQMHAALVLDSDREPIRPAMLWNDNRATAESVALARAVPDIGQIAGVPPLPGLTAPKLAWLAAHAPEDHARIAHVLLAKDFIALQLTGEIGTDMSDAAGTLLLDQAARAWSTEIAAAVQVDPAWLPPLHEATEVIGHVTASCADATGLPKGCPVVMGGGDTAVGAVAVGVTEPGRGAISMGTSGQIFVATDRYRPNPDAFLHAFAHALPARWFQMAAMLNGARPLAWMAAKMGLQVGAMLELAARADLDRIPTFLPYLTGERSPHGDPHIRAAFYGMDDATTQGELARAVVEAVAFSFADGAASFGAGLDDVPHLLALGGGARSDMLLQTIADATGVTLGRALDAAAGPAMGAARLAGVGAGALSLSDLAQQPDVADWFEPAPTPDPRLRARLDRYRALYAALKPLARVSADG
ncbi:xylulokinase [Maribius pontilimi]|uniref:Xylulose kinase n=1 Tax=Palleronia pontilimi TaxID=1964209 RepID=A0A934MDC5_9RHOB|nr:xylulokinase [Palleronia pontilimi]